MAALEPTPSEEPLRVELGERSYEIRFIDDSPEAVAAAIRPYCPERAFVVTNEVIDRLHGDRLRAAFGMAGIAAGFSVIGDGEKYKVLDTASTLYDRLIAGHFSRKTCVVAFGGGVVGDLAGFVAATYLRGVDFVQIPTTVLSMVDSSVGGKTGVDHPMGKNLIGAFHQPRVVAIDSAYLRILDEHNRRGGFAEIIKYGVIADGDFFSFLEGNIDRALALEASPLRHAIRTSCAIKARVVAADEREGGLRAILNYGHTFGHAIESLGQYRETQFHGQAVAIGMIAAGRVALSMRLWDRQSCERQEKLLERAGLPTRLPASVSAAAMIDAMKSDKKAGGGRQRFVLPRSIGSVEVRDDVPRQTVLEILRTMGASE